MDEEKEKLIDEHIKLYEMCFERNIPFTRSTFTPIRKDFDNKNKEYIKLRNKDMREDIALDNRLRRRAYQRPMRSIL